MHLLAPLTAVLTLGPPCISRSLRLFAVFGVVVLGLGIPDRAHADKPICGDGIRAGGEQCDLGDDDSCPGQCQLEDCTCPSLEPEPPRSDIFVFDGEGNLLGPVVTVSSTSVVTFFREEIDAVMRLDQTRYGLAIKPASAIFGSEL